MNLSKLEEFRKRFGPYGTKPGQKFGLFEIPHYNTCATLHVISAPMEEGEWEHVSVSLKSRCPNWNEMNYIKELFWHEDQTVVQFHPKKSNYVNIHKYCLHLWRHRGGEYKLPPTYMV